MLSTSRHPRRCATPRALSPLRSLAALALSLSLAACSSASASPEAPEAPTSTAGPAASASASAEATADAPAPSTPKKPTDAELVPDDYLLTEGDCAQLGTQYARAITADESAKVSPKLSDKQREATLARIEEVAAKMSADWKKGCRASLVGKAVERKSLSCALEARSVAQFDKCLNG